MKFKLLGKVLISTLIPIFLGISVLAVLSSRLSSGGLYEMADIQLLEFAKKQASEIDSIMDNATRLADMMDGDDNIEQLSAMANSLSTSRSTDESYLSLQKVVNATLAEIVEDFPDITGVVIIAKDGKNVGFSAPSLEGINASKYASVLSAFQGKAMTSTLIAQSTKKMSAMVASPITADGSNELADAVLLFVVNLDMVSTETIKDIKLMPSSNPFLLSNEGVILMERAFPELIGTDNSSEEFAKIMMREKTGIARYEYEGVPKVAHFAELPTSKWILGIETDESDFYITSNKISLYLGIAGFIILLIVAAIIYMVINKVVIVVSQSAEIATYVANGNLKLTAEQEGQINNALKRNDEFTTLGIAFSTMVKNLGQMVMDSEEKSKQAQVAAEEAAHASKEAEKSAQEAEEKRKSILEAVVQLEGIVNNISSASEQLSRQIELSTSGAEEQSARMTETAAAMDEMNGTVLEVARNSSSSAEIADNTKIKATDGAEITHKCQESMTQVKDESMKLRQNMSELANHAQSISAVMSVISDIADQTNLLALNAAIEAARAGEAGRGFAVVADEVRKLAEKTISSTTDVANAINAIQQSTEVNVQQVDAAVTRIEEATELAILGGQALQGILDMAEQSADGIRAIATASEEQSATSDEIAQSISTVSNIADTTVDAMNQASKAVSSLSDQTYQLSALVENLKNS